MSTGPRSLSRRLSRPLRALSRSGPEPRAGGQAPAEPSAGGHDTWLEHFHDDRLAPIDAACAAGGPDRLARFREFDVDLWGLLLTQEYSVYPNIRALLPGVPEAALQEIWNGASGAELASQGAAFYRSCSTATRRPATARSPRLACSTSDAAGGDSRAS